MDHIKKYRFSDVPYNDRRIPELATSTDQQLESITSLSMTKALVVDMLQTHGVFRAAAVECVQFYYVLTVVYMYM